MGREIRALSSDTGFGWQLNAANWPLTLLSGLFLFTRIILKATHHRHLWWDDYILILSWVTLAAQSVLWSVMVNLGYGKDPSSIPVQNAVQMGLILNVASTLLILANLWSKTSFALTLLRLPPRWMKCTVWVIIVSMTAFLSANTVFIWAQCFIPGQTKSLYSELECVPDSIALGYSVFAGSYSAAMDLTLALLPWRFLWNLQMKTSEKIGVTLAMSMGIFAGCAAVIKTTLFPHIRESVVVGAQVVTWSVVEASLSIMAASIPILRALLGQRTSPPPMGYDYETGESGAGFNRSMQSSMTSTTGGALVDAASPPLAVSTDNWIGWELRGKEKTVGRNVATGKVQGKHDRWADPDKIGYEMTSYGVEAHPVDFTAH